MRTALRKLGKRLPTANRLTALMLATSLLLVIVAGLGAWYVRQLQADSEANLSINVRSIRAAVELELHIQELRHQIDRYAWRYDDDPGPPGRGEVESIQARRKTIEHWLERTTTASHTEEEKVYAWRVREGLDEFFERIDRLAEVDRVDEKLRLAQSAEHVLEEQVIAPARSYLIIDEALLEASRQESARHSLRLAVALLSLGIVGAVAASIAGFSLAGSISQSLLELRIPIQDVAGKLREVAGDVVVSTQLDLDDLGPALARVSAEVSSVVEQLHRRHEEIQRAERLAAMGRLAAGLAHEIRNPLTAMKMIVQSGLRIEGAVEGRDLSILDEEIRRLETLLEEFLDFARPRPLKTAIVDLRDSVEGAVAAIQRLADARGVAIECSTPNEPVPVSLDVGRIRQVLLNLLINGIEETPRGKTVAVRIDADAAPKTVSVVIEDEGPGIDEVAEPRLFEPFYSTKESGLGLGLPVSRRIVESHGGAIVAQAGLSGSTFVVTLPSADE